MDEDLKKLKNRVAQWELDTDGMSYIITCDELFALIAAAERERELVEALRPFALFFDAAIEAWSDGHDLDGGDIQEIAASLGLLRETVFNSEVHTDELGVDAQDGDPWFVLSDMASKAIRDAQALQAKEVVERFAAVARLRVKGAHWKQPTTADYMAALEVSGSLTQSQET
jgi:hypothetical protein